MKEVREYLNNLLKKESKVVIACSGGPDSMSLLDLVLSYKDEKNLQIICAHVNHKVRKESDEEAIFVKKYCEANDIVFEYMEIKDYTDDNFHNQARTKRYDFFNALIEKYNAIYLMTAHHGDDLTETILMRIVRGSNLKGYIGFKKETDCGSYKLIRPLISVTKDEILKYTEEKNIAYVLDKSNEKDKYTRNRYRHNILPALKNEEELVHKKFLKFSEELNKYDLFLGRFLSNVLTTLIKDDTLDIPLFLRQDEFVKQKIIEKMIEKIQQDDLFAIEDKHVSLILDLINSEKPNNKILLPNNYVAIKSYNSFKIIKEEKHENYCIKLDDKTKINSGTITYTSDTSDFSNYMIRLNSEEITLPLYVRNRCDGDKIEVKNLNGTKKIKDVFIDEKVPLYKREVYPIVVDSNDTILWVPGLKKSKFDKEITDTYDIILKYEEEKNDK